jgi:hypothetical protein
MPPFYRGDIAEVLQLQELENVAPVLTLYKEPPNYGAKREQGESRLESKYKRI